MDLMAPFVLATRNRMCFKVSAVSPADLSQSPFQATGQLGGLYGAVLLALSHRVPFDHTGPSNTRARGVLEADRQWLAAVVQNQNLATGSNTVEHPCTS